MVTAAARRVRRIARATVTALVAGAGLAPPASAHPLHTTLTEITTGASGRTLHAVIRVFADDFGRAVARGGRSPASPGSADDAVALAYVQRTFVLAGRDGRVLPHRSCGIRRTADLLWICVEAASPGGLSGIRVRNAMLCDLYDDQVNIVRAISPGATNTLMFTRNESAKPLV